MYSSEVGLLISSVPWWGKADWQSSKGSQNRTEGWVSFTKCLKRTRYNLIGQVPSMGHFYPACHVFSRRQEGTHLNWVAVCSWLRIILPGVVSTEKQVKSHPSSSKDTTSFYWETRDKMSKSLVCSNQDLGCIFSIYKLLGR